MGRSAQEWQREQEYRIYQDAVKLEQEGALEIAAIGRTYQISLDLRTEIDFAKAGFLEAERVLPAGTGWMNLLVASWIRAYRSMEWYRSEVGQAVADATSEPFQTYFQDGKKAKAREFFRVNPLDALRDSVIDTIFERHRLGADIRSFLGNPLNEIRQKVVHGIYVPSPKETRERVNGAIALYNRIDAASPGHLPAPIDLLPTPGTL